MDKTKRREEISPNMCDTLARVIEELQSILAEHPDAEMTLTDEYGEFEVLVTWIRDETEGEMEFRLKGEAMYEKRRRESYEKLKKEFENE